MNVSLRVPSMTRDQFLDWAERQDASHEFDGFEPVAVTGGTIRHGLLCSNLLLALREQLRTGGWNVLMEAGLATIGNAVRFPDVAILPAGSNQSDRLMADAVVIFEVLSPSTAGLDCTVKLCEYRAVSSILRYVIVDSAGPELMIFSRPPGGGEWIASESMPGETLSIPEVGIDIPVNDIFAGIVFD